MFAVVSCIYFRMHMEVTQQNKGLLIDLIDLDVEMKLKIADFNLIAPFQVTYSICRRCCYRSLSSLMPYLVEQMMIWHSGDGWRCP